MTQKNAIQFIAFCIAMTRGTATFAHENHGLAGTHWHATDTWGFVVTGALIALAVWLGGRGK
jgi:hypothetical protein